MVCFSLNFSFTNIKRSLSVMRKTVFSFGIIILLIFNAMLWKSCNIAPSYPPSLKQAIDLFYIENQNDSILLLLDSDKNIDKRFPAMKQIFKAGALCENGKVDSASAMIESINKEHIDKTSAFWYAHIKGLIRFRENRSTEAYETLLKAVSNKHHDIRAITLSERIIARILFSYGSHKDVIEWMVKSSQHFQQAGLEKSIGINEKILGRYYMITGCKREAFNCFTNSENILTKHNDIPELYYTYINLIDYYITTKNLDKAKQYAEMGLDILKNWDDNQMRVVLYNNLGEIKLLQGKPEEAEPFFKETVNTPPNYVGANIRIINALIFLSEISAQKGDSEQAIKYALQAKTFLGSPGKNFHSQYKVYNQLADLYITMPDENTYKIYRDSADVYSKAIRDEQSGLSKDIYDIKTELLQSTYAVEQMQVNERNHKLIIVVILIALFALALAFVQVYRTWKSKTDALKSLAKKNLRLAEEERRKLEEIRQQSANRQSTRKQIDEDQTQLLYTRILMWLEENDNFKRKDLNVENMANELHSNREYISQAINANGLKFNDLINQFRVKEAMNILSNPTHDMFSQKNVVYCR